MGTGSRQLTRRDFVLRSSSALLSGTMVVVGFTNTAAGADLTPVDIAYAGSMSSVMEGPVKTAAARTLKLDFHGRAQGSSALAQLIVGGGIRPDVFVPITPGPMQIVIRAGKAEVARPIARTEMVIAYSPRSRFAPEFDAAARGSGNWWEILQKPGLRFGRTDPVTDPQGRNIIFTVMLASKLYKRPDLATRILGSALNARQIFSEPTVQARLQSGQLDAASAYRSQPPAFKLQYLTLPQEINLSGENVHAHHPEISLTVGGKTYVPEPLIYYAAALKDAPNPKGAGAFVDWLRGGEAQDILKRFHYDPSGDASPLSARGGS